MKGPHGEEMPPAIAIYLEAIGNMAQTMDGMLADLYTALEEGRPWSLVRLGDGEVHSLNGVHAPWAYYANRCASIEDAGELRQHSITAIAEADWVGWIQDQWLSRALELGGLLPKGWTAWWLGILQGQKRQPTADEILARFGKEPSLIARSQFGWCNLHMGIRRGFVERVLRTQKLFLVGAPMQQWLDEILRPAGLGNGAVVWGGDTTVSTMAQANEIVDAFVKSSARVMLASLGVWALPVVGRVRELGGVGIDWGHLPDHNVKASCEAHREGWGAPVGSDGRCPDHPSCQAHWRYRLNIHEEDSPAGTMRWYRKAGTAGQCLPDGGF